jgi:NAD(P)-dependent dehydrogenase (short-subunit alcohol dehydrogenase family)
MPSRMTTMPKGLTIAITGATSGVGEALARQLITTDVRLLIHGRDARKLEALTGELDAAAPGKVQALVADLSSLADVARLARELGRTTTLDVLVNNAGVGFGANRSLRETSRDGHELRFAVNYLAPFLLTELLTRAGLPKRAVVNVASAGQAPLDESDLESERDYDGVLAYRRSKLALILETFERARRDRERAYVALHPGTFLATKMVREANIPPQGSAEEGAAAVRAVIERALRGETGRYYDRERPARAESDAYAEALQNRLRDRTLGIVAPYAT